MLREMVTRPMVSDAKNGNRKFLKRLLWLPKGVLKLLKMIWSPQHHDLAKYRVALLALAVAIPGGYLGFTSLRERAESVGEQVESISKQAESISKQAESVAATLVARKLRITSPAEGEFVTQMNRIEGTTPFPDRTHYLIVTPHLVGTRYVEPNPVHVDPSGRWAGVAGFGTAGAGIGQLFVVQVLATEADLVPGPLVEEPPDAVYSQAVTVARKN